MERKNLDVLETRISDLEYEVKRIKKLYEKTLFYEVADPEVALSQARKSAEAICKSIYLESKNNDTGKPIHKLMLNDLILLLNKENIVPRSIIISLNTIQQFGNFGVHDQGEESEIIDVDYVKPCLLALGIVFNWYVTSFHNGSIPDFDKFINKSILSTNSTSNNSVKEEIKRLKPQKEFVVVGNHAPPARIFDEEKPTGFYFDLLRAIGYKKNIKFKFVEKSFDMSLRFLKMGKADIMIGPNKRKHLENYLIYSKRTLPKVRKAFFANMDVQPIIELEDLYSKILVTAKNTYYSKDINDNPEIKKVEVSNYLTAFNLVEKHKNYVLIVPELQGDYLLEETNKELVKSPYYIEGESSYICYSKKIFSENDSIIQDIEEGLELLVQEGTYEDILNLYNS